MSNLSSIKVTINIYEGPDKGKIFEIHEQNIFVVGRSDKANIKFGIPDTDPGISRIHFQMDVKLTKCIIKDLNSKNGTYLNDKPIKEAELKDGDKIQIGKSVLKINIEEIKPVEKKKPVYNQLPSKLKFNCNKCGIDLSEMANIDGRAEEFEKAIYICKKCIIDNKNKEFDFDMSGEYSMIGVLGKDLKICRIIPY